MTTSAQNPPDAMPRPSVLGPMLDPSSMGKSGSTQANSLQSILDSTKQALKVPVDYLDETAYKVLEFVKTKWSYLLAHVIAGAATIIFMGTMSGFTKVALPLSVGIGCGMVFGLLTAIFTAKFYDRDGELREKGMNTIWGLIHNGVIKHLNPNGTRQIVISVAITVFLATAALFPHAVGAVAGIVIANQICMRFFEFDPEAKIEKGDEKDRHIEELRGKLKVYEEALSTLNESFQTLKDEVRSSQP